jgi:nucleotide-binding universal stress UspA family protein
MSVDSEHRDIGLMIRNVVVGVDGSPESLSALRFAAHMAGTNGVVHPVCAVSPALELAVAAVQIDSSALIARIREDLESDWTAAVRDAGQQISCRVVEDDPADALLEAAEDVDADLVVVGVHAKPAHGPRTVGRVTAKLIKQMNRPLAIIDGDEAFAVGHVAAVVADAGKGGATPSAVRWAARFADTYGTALRLVRSTPYRPALGPDGLLDVLAFYLEPSMLREWAIEDLTELADQIQQSTEHDLSITWSAPTGPRGPRLIDVSGDTSLIVVGRNTPTGAGRSIPAALRHVVTHAPCPVVVVPAEKQVR